MFKTRMTRRFLSFLNLYLSLSFFNWINMEESFFFIIIIIVFLMDNLLLIEKIFMSMTRYNILLNKSCGVICSSFRKNIVLWSGLIENNFAREIAIHIIQHLYDNHYIFNPIFIFKLDVHFIYLKNGKKIIKIYCTTKYKSPTSKKSNIDTSPRD